MTVTRDVQKIDATGKTLGRLSTEIAQYLMGKHKPTYQPHIDAGDIVEVFNIDKLRITGDREGKVYHWHSGYPGGVRSKTQEQVWNERPAQVLEMAVSRMLPKNKHRTARLKRLKIS